MANKYLTSSNPKSLNQKFRSKRFKFFTTLLKRIKSDKPLKILDVGGREIYWERMTSSADVTIPAVQITLLNIEEIPSKNKDIINLIGDARDLSQYKDGEFDIVYSNSVIEHLFSKENQVKMAKEVARVGKYYYIQTPNYYFPMEPHWLTPFFQFLPFGVRVFMTRKFNLGHFKKQPDKEKAVSRVSSVKLLTEKEMKELFPDGKVYREYILGMKKSMTMYRFPEE